MSLLLRIYSHLIQQFLKEDALKTIANFIGPSYIGPTNQILDVHVGWQSAQNFLKKS